LSDRHVRARDVVIPALLPIGNSVGITRSQSFGSKGGEIPGAKGTDNAPPMNPRAKFARAKAGAWRLILALVLADLDDSDE
jgi:hypothetical protein